MFTKTQLSMANTPINMSKLRQVLKLHLQGTKKLQISTVTGVSRNTVKKYLTRLRDLDLNREEIQGHTDHELDMLFCGEPLHLPDMRIVSLHVFFDKQDKRLRERGMNLEKLYELYRRDQDGVPFARTAFYRHHAIWKLRTSPSMHIDHKAGDKVYVDYAGERLQVLDPATGEIRKVEVFVAILGASQLTYVEAVESQRAEDFIGCCENALHYFGGVPMAIVPDNLKAAVIKTNRYEPQLNENFEAFANHYDMSVLPARSYKPKDKALVEGAVKITYTKIYTRLPKRLPRSLEELNVSISTLLEDYNNDRFKGRSYSRRELFHDIEENCLQALPQERYEMRRSLQATVMKNGHICMGPDKNYYSVPHAYISKRVRVFFNRSRVDVFFRHEQIASHKRYRRARKYTTEQAHLASHHQVISEWSPEYFLAKARAIDPVVEDYLREVLSQRQHPEQAYKTCQGILSFARRVGNERLVGACRRAQSFGVYRYKAIEEIIKKGLDKAQDEEEHLQMPKHNNIRGQDYYSKDSTDNQPPHNGEDENESEDT